MGGHKIHYDEVSDVWKYSDNNEVVDSHNERSCIKCGKHPTPEGHDACIANLGTVVNACCGHGVEEGYIQFDNGVIIRGHFKVETDIEYGKLYTGYMDAYDGKERKMDKFEVFLDETLSSLRQSRDVLFNKYNLDKKKVYASGQFDKLPPDLLMKVCYVDAYASVRANYRLEDRFELPIIIEES